MCFYGWKFVNKYIAVNQESHKLYVIENLSIPCVEENWRNKLLIIET